MLYRAKVTALDSEGEVITFTEVLAINMNGIIQKYTALRGVKTVTIEIDCSDI